jgi:oligopeptide/dipeptide ABC transporter ATP-binding protein
MVFQDPYSSLNPRMAVFDILAEPLMIHGIAKSKSDLSREVKKLMQQVGLSPRFAYKYPHEFSGGQRQRIAIARALAPQPKVIICDEPVSALDVSIQAQILNLLQSLQKDLNLSYIFIAHDLSVVRHISHRIAVMYLGKIVEIAQTEELFQNPKHPYTRALLSAIPIPDPRVEANRQRILLKGDPPSPMSVIQGCHFASRCHLAGEDCKTSQPELMGKPSHKVACLRTAS